MLKLKLKIKIINIFSAFIFNRNKRNEYKKVNIEKIYSDFLKKQKWGVSYSVFDGEELLEASIDSIRQNVDYINVVYQIKSWYGEENNNLLKTLIDLYKKGKIDELIEYKYDCKKHPNYAERDKRILGLKYALKAGCTYFMPIDCDEFYLEQEIKEAKKFIIENQITHCFCSQIRYGINPDEILLGETFTHSKIQFFSHVDFTSTLNVKQNLYIHTDPTRIIKNSFNFGCYKFGFLNKVNMHHMSYIRKNIDKKFNNTSNENCKEIYRERYAKAIASEKVHVKDLFNLKKIMQQW